MQIIKFSTPWSHLDFNSRISAENPNPNYQFDFADSFAEYDYWVVWGGIKGSYEKAICPPENIIYLTDEVHNQRFFNQSFLDQFAAIITCREDLTHKKIITSEHELNTWLVNKDYDFLANNDFYKKDKLLSVVCSDQTWLPGHKLRYAFVNKLIGHFKSELDVFGNGFNPIDDKFDALAPYKYSIAIENASIPSYFTEKITDCYLTNTMPLYYGCPNINQFFDPASFALLDPNNFIESIKKIEELIHMNYYEKAGGVFQTEKLKYLQQYHIFNKLPLIVEKTFSFSENRKQITIKNESFFTKENVLKKLVKRVITK